MKNYRKTNVAANLYELFGEIYSGEELDRAVRDALKAYQTVRYENDFYNEFDNY